MPSPEWLIERGIGETRAALVEEDRIVEARILVDGTLPAGSDIAARLVDIGRNGRNAVAEAGGVEYLLPQAPKSIAQGASLNLQITREAIPGIEPWKRPLARLTDAVPGLAPTLEGRELVFPGPRDVLDEAGWPDLLEEARSRTVRFEGGELRLSPTPAMTLIDVDGWLDPAQLAVAGAGAAAQAIRRLGIGGSIGVDLPTLRGRAERHAAAEAIDIALPQPFERTAVNGFGFVQIIRPRRHASLLEIFADCAAAEARALLRRAARETGSIRLAANPGIFAALEAHPDWIEALSRQVGGSVTLRADASLAMSGGHADQA